jgi:hypothetical protein
MTPDIVKELVVEFCVMVRGFVRTRGVEMVLLLVTVLPFVIATVPALPCKLRVLVDAAAMV